MTPPSLDREQAGARLRTMRETLDELASLRGVDAARLEAEPLTRAAAERLIQVVVDLAVDINAHVAVVATGAAPQTGRDSFFAAATSGAMTEDLAAALAPAAGLRNVLVLRYTDIRTDLVAAAIDTVLDGFAEYVRQVATYLAGPA